MNSIYFLHIPKTAGSSFKRILSSMYPQQVILEFYTRGQLLDLDIDKHLLLLGHLGFDISNLTQGFDVVTFLRDPHSRAVSNYHQILRSPEHYLHNRTKEFGSFSAFIRDKSSQDCISNIQTKYLGLDINFAQVIECHTFTSLQALAPQELHSKLLNETDESLVLKNAIERLTDMTFFGLCERFEDSMLLFQKAYPEMEMNSLPVQENVTRDGVKLGDLCSEDIGIIRSLNRLDIQLYQSAVELFDYRWKQRR